MNQSILTAVGRAKLMSATPEQQLLIAYIAVGDGDGQYQALNENMTSLVREVWRGPASAPVRDAANHSLLMFSVSLPPDAGDFFVREIAIFDTAGDMIGIGQTHAVQQVAATTVNPGAGVTVQFAVQLQNAGDADLVYTANPLDLEARIQELTEFVQDQPKITRPGGSDPLGGFADYADLRAYSGQATESKILADGHYGAFYKLEGQALNPIPGRVIIDADGNPWVRRIRNGIIRLSWSCVGDGETDDSDGFCGAVENGAGYTVHGDPLAKYRIRRKVVMPSNVHLRLNGATLIDDVQGRRGHDHGGRPDALFYAVAVENITVNGFKYKSLPTRVQDSETIPVGIIWIGDQVEADDTSVTRNICFSDFSAVNIPESAIFCSVAGESEGITFENVNLYGDCLVGVNFEYGLAASVEDYPGNYGRHPHNCLVRNFNGFNNSKSIGFLRTASVYGVKFEDCYGFDVRAFIYCWTGDRSINRLAQSVVYERCNHFATPNFLGSVANVCAQILSPDMDGSTDEPLPSWTNQHHLIELRQCNLKTNKVTGSCAVRVYGMFGTVRLTDVAYEGGDYGLRVGPSINPAHGPNYSLIVSGGFMRGNNRDIDLFETNGCTFEDLEFLSQTLDANVSLSSNSANNRFLRCKFPVRNNTLNPHVTIDGSSLRNAFYDNNFPEAAERSVAANGLTFGANNIGGNIAGVDYLSFGLIGQAPATECPFPVSVTVLDARKRRIYNIGASSETLTAIYNGEIGDEVIIVTTLSSSSLTIINNAVAALSRILTRTGADETVSGAGKIVVLKQTSLGWVVL